MYGRGVKNINIYDSNSVTTNHDGRGEGQVAGDGREVERRDGGDETLERSVTHLGKKVKDASPEPCDQTRNLMIY